jgi:hypothetical protein
MRHLTRFVARLATIAAGLAAVAVLSGSTPRDLYSGRPASYGTDLDTVERLVGYHLPGPPSTASGWQIRDILVVPTYLEPPPASSIVPGRPAAVASAEAFFGGPLCSNGVPRCVSVQYTSDNHQTIVLNVGFRPQSFPRHFPPVTNAPGVHAIKEQYAAVDIAGVKGTLATDVLIGPDDAPIFTTVYVQWRLGNVTVAAVGPVRTEGPVPTRDLMTSSELIAFLSTFH